MFVSFVSERKKEEERWQYSQGLRECHQKKERRSYFQRKEKRTVSKNTKKEEREGLFVFVSAERSEV